jgi:hypothetical protein
VISVLGLYAIGERDRGNKAAQPVAQTFVFAPRGRATPKTLRRCQKQLHNYGAKDMVHNERLFVVCAP